MSGPARKRGPIRIGTSGWSYSHWRGRVYPEGMPGDERLAFYASELNTVEIDSTFYRLPSKAAVEGWRRAVPSGFVFAVKASRYVTHMKKLKDPERSTARFFEAIGSLGEKLGPVLFQLPPRWRVNRDRLATFLAAMPAGRRYAVEFRDPSWYCDPVMDALEAREAALCIHDFQGSSSPMVATSDFVYVRLHGVGEMYAGRYGTRRLQRWAGRISDWADQGRDVHVYFNNDANGHAFDDARALRSMLDPREQRDQPARGRTAGAHGANK